LKSCNQVGSDNAITICRSNLSYILVKVKPISLQATKKI